MLNGILFFVPLHTIYKYMFLYNHVNYNIAIIQETIRFKPHQVSVFYEKANTGSVCA